MVWAFLWVAGQFYVGVYWLVWVQLLITWVLQRFLLFDCHTSAILLIRLTSKRSWIWESVSVGIVSNLRKIFVISLLKCLQSPACPITHYEATDDVLLYNSWVLILSFWGTSRLKIAGLGYFTFHLQREIHNLSPIQDQSIFVLEIFSILLCSATDSHNTAGFYA